jgi:hypothetical protein
MFYSASGVVLYREYQQQGADRLAQRFLHPVDISAEKTAWTLRSLVYEKRALFGKPEDVVVFTPQEVKALAEPLSLALGAIGPNERLRFLVMRSNWKDVLLAPTGTSAVVFRREAGVLNFAFDAVHDAVSGDETGNPRNIAFRIEPTTYVDASPLVPHPGTRLRVDPVSGKPFPRWLEVMPDELQLPPLAVSGATEPSTAAGAPASPATAGPATASPAPASPATAGPATAGPATAGAATAVAAQPAPSGSPAAAGAPPPPAVDEERFRQVRERIAILQRLRAEGTITEEQYREALGKLLVGSSEGERQE